MLYPHLSVSESGHLCLGGVDTVDMAEKYGTPLMLFDEDRIRQVCRTYVEGMKKYFAEGSGPLLASKAFCCRAMYRLAAEEGLRTDIVSPGELYTAYTAGFPMERAYFHGNNKTDADIAYAMDCGIGTFIVDNREEADSIEREAASRSIRQHILLRLTPGIDPHTHAAISTGKVDSKFGTAIETGQAAELVDYILTLPHIILDGFHCHIGSQIFECKPFTDAADIMMRFMAEMEKEHDIALPVLNLGGGFGVRYIEEDPVISYTENLEAIAAHIRARSVEYGIAEPVILMEPGRSIVADAGITLYTVGSVKTIRGYKSYVSIDGGMTDNPRYALYGSQYTCLLANHADKPADFCATVAGRCCESGDLIQEDVMLARPVRGDILAVLTTGAYNYAMASNYNRVPRPPVVFLHDGADRLVIRRETYEDVAHLDV